MSDDLYIRDGGGYRECVICGGDDFGTAEVVHTAHCTAEFRHGIAAHVGFINEEPTHALVRVNRRYWRIMPKPGVPEPDCYHREFTDEEEALDVLAILSVHTYEVVEFLDGKVLRADPS